MQKRGLEICRASDSPTDQSAQASTTPQGRSTAISRANEGPDSTATTACGSISASTSGMSAWLPRSMPLEQLTTGVDSRNDARMSPATSRKCCAGTAIRMKSLPWVAAARLPVARMP